MIRTVMKIKTYLRERSWAHFYRALLHRYTKRPIDYVFRDIHRKNGFRGEASISGPGSDLEQTASLRAELPALIRELGVRSMLDAPCGDFYWMKETRLDLDRYIGADIVPELVAQDRQRYGTETRSFVHLDITRDPLPRTDLIFCRDCLVHLPHRTITAALGNFKRSGATYLLTTTFTNERDNRDIVTGDWRPLNLERPPFALPRPLRLINERCTQGNGRHADKSMGLWRLSDIP